MQRRKIFLFLSFFSLPLSLPAQSPVSSTIYVASRISPKNEYIRAGLGSQTVTAMTADGRLWVLGYWSDGAKKLRETRLFMSADGGRSWSFVTKARVREGTDGAMAVGNDGTTLHLLWTGRQSTPPPTGKWFDWSIYYGKFDTVKMQWVGQDRILWKASGSGASKYNCYGSPAIAVNRDGYIAAAAVKNRGWTTFVRIDTGKGFGPPFQLHTGTAMSVRPNVLAGPDGCFHFAYRSGSGTQYNSYYRRYDPYTLSFGKEGQILVRNKTGNDQVLSLTDKGDIFIAYVVDGSLEVSHALIGAWKFQSFQVAADSTVKSGNTSYYCNRVGRTAGGKTAVFFALPQEKRKAIYARDWTGTGLGPKRTVVTGPANAQFWYHDDRSGAFDGRGMFLTYVMKLYDNKTPPNQISYILGARLDPAGVVPFGRSCKGSNGKVPVLGASHIPYLGNMTFGIELSGARPASAAVLILGTSRTSFAGMPLPLALGPFGITGCTLYTNILSGLGAATGTGGTAKVLLPIPNNPVLAGGLLYSQWLAVDPGSPGGIRFTGAGSILPR